MVAHMVVSEKTPDDAPNQCVPSSTSSRPADAPTPAAIRTTRLLVVDDNVELLNAIREALLSEGYEVVAFTEPAAALSALRAGEYDLVLSDLMMPGTDGIHLLEQVFQIDPTLVGVIMTGQGSIPTAIEAMRAGAIDFVLKPLRLQQLLSALERALEVRRMRAENDRLRREVERLEVERVRLLEETNARLAALAATDPLTGLANRRMFDEALAREIALTERGLHPVALIALDVDHFKGFNDTFGHQVGDEVLRQVASAMRGCCRVTDLVARLGGEEFGVLLPGTDLDGALALAERIRQAVADGHWSLRPVTVSAGVAILLPGEAAGQRLIETADRALYRAKRNGRNRVESDGFH